MSDRCLVCGSTTGDTGEYHLRCAKKFFGCFPPPRLDVTLDALKDYAARSVLARITVSGVQKKLSLGVETTGKNARFTVVGLWGEFILKPPVEEYPELPQNEDTIMRLAGIAGIPVVSHAFIRLASGELAFICRRIDRRGSEKIHMEDFCQIGERLTEDKYRGSLERVGKLIRAHSVYAGLDAVDFFERTIFCLLIGNADMHLKNFSLYETTAGLRLSPAYDLVSTTLVLPDDSEESALTINGKKARLTRSDFDTLSSSLAIPPEAAGKVFAKFQRLTKDFIVTLRNGWLSSAMQERLAAIITRRAETLFHTQ